jgi:hypothetical protein
MAVALPLAVTFVLGMSPAAVPQSAFWMAAAANLVAAVLLALHLRALLAHGKQLPVLVRFGLVFLAIYLVTAAIILVPGVWRVSVGGQLRVFYLHNLLLGFMSSLLLGLVLPVLRGEPTAGRLRGVGLDQAVVWLWMVGVAVMVASLLGLGLARWLPVSAVFWLRLAAWSSLLPAAAAILALFATPRPVRTAT